MSGSVNKEKKSLQSGSRYHYPWSLLCCRDTGIFDFEMISINYRPILINGVMEASYPSSTTLLVLCVMPTLIEQIQRRLSSIAVKRIVTILAIAFSAFMVIGRLISGVHWFTDIVGGVLLSAGLFTVYKAVVMLTIKSEIKGGAGGGIP